VTDPAVQREGGDPRVVHAEPPPPRLRRSAEASREGGSVDLRWFAVGPPFQGGHLLIVVTLASILLSACAHHLPGVPYAAWELRGTIVDVHDNHVLVRHKSGQVVDLVVDDRTTIIGSEGKATLSVLTRGRRVVVNVEPQADGHGRAARVQAFGS
jgi:hypothetical protein